MGKSGEVGIKKTHLTVERWDVLARGIYRLLQQLDMEYKVDAFETTDEDGDTFVHIKVKETE